MGNFTMAIKASGNIADLANEATICDAIHECMTQQEELLDAKPLTGLDGSGAWSLL